ncbi:MAG TPA: hypothetical protein VN680_14165 [Burkholderiaceae bacterium]|jgi:hypothetical protein|nr:hypothetical protein [Burkholderiaceae bacterium]
MQLSTHLPFTTTDALHFFMHADNRWVHVEVLQAALEDVFHASTDRHRWIDAYHANRALMEGTALAHLSAGRIPPLQLDARSFPRMA